MTKVTQKQLVEQIKMLKEIKPRQEWVSLLKSEILAERKVEYRAGFASFLFQKKLVYSFAGFLFVVMGILGFAPYTMPGNLSEQSALIQKTNVSSAIAEIKTNAPAFTKNLKNGTANKAVIQQLANTLKTLADSGTDLTSNQDVKDLTQTVVSAQISDLQKSTLTDGQQKILKTAEDLYSQGKYTDALEQVLSISK